jgi:hypothetical protein
MKTFLLTSCIALGLCGCASLQSETPMQIAATVCPSINSGLSQLKTDGFLTGGAADTLSNQVMPDINAVCAAGATVTTTSLQNLVNAALPVIVTAIDNSSLSADKKNTDAAIVGGIALAINTGLALQ